MIKIKDKDYRDILHLVYEANCCEDVDSFIRGVLPRIAEMFHCECITFQLVEGFSGRIRIIESKSFKAVRHDLIEDGYFPALYKDDYYHDSPLLKDAIRSQSNVLKIGDSISFSEWERSAMYNNFILPQNLYWELFLALRHKGILQGMVTLWRDLKHPDFETADISRAEIMVPNLAVALHNTRYVSLINSWKQRLLTQNEDSNEGLLLLDDRLNIYYFNAKAADICSQLAGKTNTSEITKGTDFAIPSYITRDCISLMNMVKVTEMPVVLPRERLIFAENGRPVRIESSIIWKSDKTNSVRPYFIVRFSDEEERRPTDKFNLSKRELDILYCLKSGLSYIEIAEKLFISKFTVHTHVKNIYRKLGVHNKIELIKNVQSPT